MDKINFFVVYVKTKKKLDKYMKVNQIKKKFVIDVKKIIEEEELDKDDLTYLKIIIYNKIEEAMMKNKDIYYIPLFDSSYNINKLFNIKKLLGSNNFNVLVFYDEFNKNRHIVNEVIDNMSKFSYAQIVKDY